MKTLIVYRTGIVFLQTLNILSTGPDPRKGWDIFDKSYGFQQTALQDLYDINF